MSARTDRTVSSSPVEGGTLSAKFTVLDDAFVGEDLRPWTKVPLPTSPDVRPRVSASAYAFETVPTLKPSHSAISRWGRSRIPGRNAPVSISADKASTKARYFAPTYRERSGIQGSVSSTSDIEVTILSHIAIVQFKNCCTNGLPFISFFHPTFRDRPESTTLMCSMLELMQCNIRSLHDCTRIMFDIGYCICVL